MTGVVQDVHSNLSLCQYRQDSYPTNVAVAGRALAILIAATIVAEIVAAGARPRTRATVSSHKH